MIDNKEVCSVGSKCKILVCANSSLWGPKMKAMHGGEGCKCTRLYHITVKLSTGVATLAHIQGQHIDCAPFKANVPRDVIMRVNPGMGGLIGGASGSNALPSAATIDNVAMLNGYTLSDSAKSRARTDGKEAMFDEHNETAPALCWAMGTFGAPQQQGRYTDPHMQLSAIRARWPSSAT